MPEASGVKQDVFRGLPRASGVKQDVSRGLPKASGVKQDVSRGLPRASGVKPWFPPQYMTTQNLLNGLKELLDREYAEAVMKLDDPAGSYAAPRVRIGFLPTTTAERDFPSVVIVPPTEATDDEEKHSIPVTLVLSITHADTAAEPDAFMDILTLAERTKEILMSKNIIGAFRRTGKVTWGVDSMAGRSVTVSIGEINATYQTKSSYREDMES